MKVQRERLVTSLAEALAVPRSVIDARVPHGVLVAAVLGDAALRQGVGTDFGRPFLAGMVMLLLVTVVLLASPPTRLPRSLVAGLAMVDLLGVGLSRVDDAGVGTIGLATLPAYFLGRHFGRVGVALTGVGAAAFVVGPAALLLPVDGPQLARLVAGSVVVVAGSVVAAVTVEQVDRDRRLMAAIVDSVPVGLMLLDGAGRPFAVKRVEALSSLDPYVDASGAASVYAPDAATPLPEDERPRARAARGEEFDDQIVWLGTDPATRRAMSVSARVVTDRHGAQTGASLASHDVTGFLRALAVKDDFVASVSHELRTPLTSLRGHLELALDRPGLDPAVHDHLRVSARSADRLNHLVDELLEAARRTGDPVVLARRPSDVGRLARESAAALAPALLPRRITLEVDAPEGAEALVDPVRIAQVIDNLLSNAVKFSAEGGTVSLTVRQDDAGLTIAVTDQGPGIASDELPQLFTRFYRSPSAIGGAVPGIGLGLSIVRDLVTAHGGEISVSSVPGAGATFSVLLPHGLAQRDRHPVLPPVQAPVGSAS